MTHSKKAQPTARPPDSGTGTSPPGVPFLFRSFPQMPLACVLIPTYAKQHMVITSLRNTAQQCDWCPEIKNGKPRPCSSMRSPNQIHLHNLSTIKLTTVVINARYPFVFTFGTSQVVTRNPRRATIAEAATKYWVFTSSIRVNAQMGKAAPLKARTFNCKDRCMKRKK